MCVHVCVCMYCKAAVYPIVVRAFPQFDAHAAPDVSGDVCMGVCTSMCIIIITYIATVRIATLLATAT